MSFMIRIALLFGLFVCVPILVLLAFLGWMLSTKLTAWRGITFFLLSLLALFSQYLLLFGLSFSPSPRGVEGNAILLILYVTLALMLVTLISGFGVLCFSIRQSVRDKRSRKSELR